MTLLKVQFLKSKVSLHNAGGLNTSSQHILLGGDVICFSYPLQVIQVTKRHTHRDRIRSMHDFQPETVSDVLVSHSPPKQSSN